MRNWNIILCRSSKLHVNVYSVEGETAADLGIFGANRSSTEEEGLCGWGISLPIEGGVSPTPPGKNANYMQKLVWNAFFSFFVTVLYILVIFRHRLGDGVIAPPPSLWIRR